MDITTSRQRLVGGMYKYVQDIVTRSIDEKKKIIIWGAGKGGAFLTHLICDIDGRKTVDLYIDEHIVLPAHTEKLNIYRASILDYISNDEYIILLTIRHDKSVIDRITEYGYLENKTFFDVRGDIGGSYLEYLEICNSNVDYSYVTKEDRPDLYSGEYFESKPFDHSSIDRVFDVIANLPCEKDFMDIGCGKGQMLVMANMAGFNKIAGIEFNNELAQVAKTNLKELDIKADIVVGDATQYKDFDEYTIFFFYNPFGEKAMLKVLDNIKESQVRRKREVYLVYGNPFYHKRIIDDHNISLYKQVEVDLHDPLLNIYRIRERK